MTTQLSPSVTNPTIAEVYQQIKSNKLLLRPDFQRRFVWTHEHQEEFLDTILRGYPFPEIYVCRGEIDLVNLTTTQHVIDGQQRLTTIKLFIEGDQEKPFKKISAYADLSEREKKDFLSYKLVMRDIGDVDDLLIREIFRRINLTKFKLESVEIHNAVYDGEFIKTAKKVLDDVDLRNFSVFHDSEFTRMADLHFILLVMATLENGGYFPQDNEIEAQIAKNNDSYENSLFMEEVLKKTFTKVSELGLANDSIWFRKSNFFTLIVELSQKLEALPDDLKSRLESFEEKILAARRDPDSDYGKYYGYMYTGTTGRKARIERSQLFVNYMFANAS